MTISRRILIIIIKQITMHKLSILVKRKLNQLIPQLLSHFLIICCLQYLYDNFCSRLLFHYFLISAISSIIKSLFFFSFFVPWPLSSFFSLTNFHCNCGACTFTTSSLETGSMAAYHTNRRHWNSQFTDWWEAYSRRGKQVPHVKK